MLPQLLSSRKLVLLSGTSDDAAANLSRFLAEHLGFEPPTVLHPLPTLGGGGGGTRRAREIRCWPPAVAIVRLAVQSRHADRRDHRTACAGRGKNGKSCRGRRKPGARDDAYAARYPQERPIQETIRQHGYPQIPLDRHDSTSLVISDAEAYRAAWKLDGCGCSAICCADN